MTLAVCIICGSKKFGAFVTCKACGFHPETGFELSLSMIYSDRVISESDIDKISGQLSEWYQHEIDFDLDHAITERIAKENNDPCWRDILTLTHTAQDGFFTKRVNAHYVTPAGYEHQILPIKKGAALDEIRRKGGNDIFFVSFDESGMRRDDHVSKVAWYASYDRNILASRSPANASLAKICELGDQLAVTILRQAGVKATDARSTSESPPVEEHPAIETEIPAPDTSDADWIELWRQVRGFFDVCPELSERTATSFAVTVLCAAAEGSFQLEDLLPSPLNVIALLSPQALDRIEVNLHSEAENCRNNGGLLRPAVGADFARLFVASARSVLSGREGLKEVFADVEAMMVVRAGKMAANRAALRSTD